ncbi:H/ACA ribonucleoprotein complex subunit 2 [Fonticula alba]|uniref:H/ACA ribonucleoprotein complex subunit 2 n=1 Tax=Fonticula alba TaxID=691883 RepID=A0A058ZHL0_FONAL|nr:H/ACA ribonucleoprotein complex subunit 2 [Fonticula alba]KCV73428.1 H/ACA ribonucleoprotein complex subunit 2 [Fonticula alba]|eukprot:XP_009493129.1 H/ACA ribonucleoprotein complex subunit 2 [Fonticula alba]
MTKVSKKSSKEESSSKKSKTSSSSSEKTEISYEDRVKNVSEIASPLASKKMTKKVLKTVKQATSSKQLRRGVKEVIKALRKKETGVVVFAGDISPIDVISHIPVLCEDNSVPYVFVPSREDLGAAGATKRPTSVIMLPNPNKKLDSSYASAHSELVTEVKELPSVLQA